MPCDSSITLRKAETGSPCPERETLVFEEKKFVEVKVNKRQRKKIVNDTLHGMYISSKKHVNVGDMLLFYEDGVPGSTPKWVTGVRRNKSRFPWNSGTDYVTWGGVEC